MQITEFFGGMSPRNKYYPTRNFLQKICKKIQSADILQKSTENLQKWVDDFCSS